jgi:hypothetical protein
LPLEWNFKFKSDFKVALFAKVGESTVKYAARRDTTQLWGTRCSPPRDFGSRSRRGKGCAPPNLGPERSLTPTEGSGQGEVRFRSFERGDSTENLYFWGVGNVYAQTGGHRKQLLSARQVGRMSYFFEFIVCISTRLAVKLQRAALAEGQCA